MGESTNNVMASSDIKEMCLISEGEYAMGSSSGYSEEMPVHKVKLKAFYMDKYLVTNKEYKIFCDKTGTAYPTNPRWTEMPDYFINYPEYPVVNVSWQQAECYAAWAGKRLPSEEEWEYAACGGLNKPLYPWGCAEVDGEKANFSERNTDYPWRDFRFSCGYQHTSPIGRYAPNGYGLYDMAGNVWEWCAGWFFPYDDAARDLDTFADGWGGSKVCRGGCFHSSCFDLRTSRRCQILGGVPQMSVGFRCAKNLDNSNAIVEKAELHCEQAQWKNKLDDVHIIPNPGVEVCMGAEKITEEKARHIKNLGFTSVEQYVTWEAVERKEEGCWDFSHWDEQVAVLKSNGLKWVPFLIAGPAYSLPDWYRESKNFQGLCCLEHNMESKVQSIWDKSFYQYIERFICAFSKHYANTDILESLLLGISGDFGEAIFPVWHGNWPLQVSGLYHSHAGYWCNDRFARKDFKQKISKKYVAIDCLNKAWGCSCNSFEEIHFPELTVDSVNGFRIDEFTDNGKFQINSLGDRIRWMDFVDWYRTSMTEYAEFWMKTARKYFPDIPVYLCTGGNAVPCHGSDFSQQCKITAKYNGGIRITNEASNYAANFILTNRIASSGSLYNAYYSYEPAGMVNEKGVVCRIYNAIASGAKGIHYYDANILDNENKADLFIKNIKSFSITKNKKNIGVLYPDVSIALDDIHTEECFENLEMLRDYTDFTFMDDLTIKDGILDTVECAVICCGQFFKKETLEMIFEWISKGGILIGYNITELHAAEDNKSYFETLFASIGGNKVVGRGVSFFIPVQVAAKEEQNNAKEKSKTTENSFEKSFAYYQKNLFDEITDFLTSNSISVADGILDGVYETNVDDGILLLNTRDTDITRGITLPHFLKKQVTIKSNSITEIKL